MKPDQLWVSDITYITVWIDGCHCAFCYLSLILDAFSGEIIGWCIGPTLAVYTAKALNMALKCIESKENPELIHHSGWGCQYDSSEYFRILEEHNISIQFPQNSMFRPMAVGSSQFHYQNFGIMG